ncbi:hypothetical protein IHQ71_02355 [Rhizobium sp. TH2]|uniref:hypothetical protein n=1 Tax=Rhizobium sp. TH2 TaxID=2775403 RepID=UPI0021580DFD|nr:hypothetical protein [Rhizobium sp. TH2]UVC09487.1 hypothetical protein IHQ71_02355 [Rhizobium sp. TH2]
MFEEVQVLLAAKVPEGRSRYSNPDIHLLIGLVFDDTGDRLAPNHAYNHGKRYRYYISGRLRHAKGTEHEGWRVPAGEIEAIVLRQATEILQNRTMIAGWLEQCAPTDGIERGLTAASELAHSLQDSADAAGRKQILNTIFKSITLSATGIRFEIRRHTLTQRLLRASRATSSGPEREESIDSEDDAVVIEHPMTIKRRGVEARIVIAGALQRKPDATLVDLIARAHLYLNRLTMAQCHRSPI